jgi:hypothetical protein
MTVDLSPFEQAADVLRGLLPDEFTGFAHRAHRYGLKLWFGASTPAREHYEAQVVAGRLVQPDATIAVEVGFHAEHSLEPDNQAVLDRLLAQEPTWRLALGPEPVPGPFLGRSSWRRLSEAWIDADLGDPDLPFEIAGRLTEYVIALEPLRHSE